MKQQDWEWYPEKCDPLAFCLQCNPRRSTLLVVIGFVLVLGLGAMAGWLL